jgi:hypothetical protein
LGTSGFWLRLFNVKEIEMSNLNEIIRQCLYQGIPVELCLHPESADGIAYVVYGFAKSGEAKVFKSVSGDICVHLRYDTKETIHNFEDLAFICKQWCIEYEARGYSVGCWEQAFKNLGWITEKTETTLEWK